MTTNGTADVSLTTISQIALRARDLDRSIEFYRETLGLPFLFRAPGMAFFQCGGVSVMLAVPEGPDQDHPSSLVYFGVDDIESAHQGLAARGVRFLGEPHVVHRAPDHELWMAFFRDPDDNTLALSCRRPASA